MTPKLNSNSISYAEEKHYEDEDKEALPCEENVDEFGDGTSSYASSTSLREFKRSITSSTGRGDVDDDDANDRNIGKNEATAVVRLRLMVFLVLVAAAVVVCVTVYWVTASALQAVSTAQYEGAAKKLTESFLDIVTARLGAVSSLGVAAVAHGLDHGKQWPFVTLSSFLQRAAMTRFQSGALYIKLIPKVEEADRSAWETYVQKNWGWV